MLLLLLTGYGIVVPPPPAELPYQGDAYYYDSSGGIGSVSGGSVQPGPNQGSPTGSITGGTVLPAETIYD